MDITFIIVNYNSWDHLKKCLESIFSHVSDYQFEILVIDNNSSDGSQYFVRNEYRNVKFFANKTNLGFSKANNIGIKYSSGKYLCLVNPDVYLIDNTVTKLFEHMENNPYVGILGPQILNYENVIQRSCMNSPTLLDIFLRAFSLDVIFPNSRFFGRYMMTYWDHNSTKDVDIINGCFWFIRKSAIDEVGFLDERFFIYAEDKDLCLRFKDNGWVVRFFVGGKAVHYGAASSASAPTKYYIELLKSNITYWEIRNGKFYSLLYSIILLLHHVNRIFFNILTFMFFPSRKSNSLNKLAKHFTAIKYITKRMTLNDA